MLFEGYMEFLVCLTCKQYTATNYQDFLSNHYEHAIIRVDILSINEIITLLRFLQGGYY